MNTFTLKPQWFFRQLPTGRCALTSETHHQEFGQEYTAILERLVPGVNHDDLNDDEFTLVEYLTERGYLNVSLHPDAPMWELSGANFQSVQEQFNHVTFNIIDHTDNGVGQAVADILVSSGMQREEINPRLMLLFTDSYRKVECSATQTILPIVCNRMRLQMGPLLFPWTPDVAAATKLNNQYMPEPRYKLPEAFDALQRAWIAASILQFVGQFKTKYVRTFCELNMGTMEPVQWAY